ncbi:hypothetical protein P9112_007593 [Eukaryota sp. TZLM1-RC]
MTRLQLLLGYTLFFFIGFAPFAVINALWAEVPIFETTLIEKQAIGTTIGFWYNWANVFPFLYVLLSSKINDYITSIFLYIIGILVCLFTAFYWDLTITFFSKDYSIGIISASFAAGFVGCTSMVTLFPFVKKYNRKFVSAVSVGMASSGFVTSLLALIQDVGYSPRFTPTVFFIILACLMALATLSLLLTPIILETTAPLDTPLLSPSIQTFTKPLTTKALFNQTKIQLLNIFLISVFFYFYMPGLLPFITIGFINRHRVYAWSNTLFQSFNLLGRFLPSLIVKDPSVFTTITGYLFYISLFFGAIGPRHPEIFGNYGWVIILISALIATLQGFIVTVVYMIVDIRIDDPHNQRKVTKWAALCNQVGSMAGSWSCFLVSKLGGFGG